MRGNKGEANSRAAGSRSLSPVSLFSAQFFGGPISPSHDLRLSVFSDPVRGGLALCSSLNTSALRSAFLNTLPNAAHSERERHKTA